MDKVKIMQFVKKYVNQSNLQFLILLIPLILLFVKQLMQGDFKIDDYLDTTILVSFALAFLCEVIAKIVSDIVMAKCEDAAKLTEDYGKLSAKYCMEPLVQHTNMVDGKEEKTRFPVICLFLRKAKDEIYQIDVDNSRAQEKYSLPGQVAERSDWLMKAHEKSVIYNNMNVRLNDVRQEGNRIILNYSRTTYFDSMVTNRVMDYAWENGKTVREVFEPGPFISKLSESKLSNHLGFNGFVETVDSKFIFVKRGNNLSIGKGTLADSIGASLKVKYCYNAECELTEDGLYNAIVEEIKDELKISSLKIDDIRSSIFAFYRDLVEGGKPQFLFYYKLKDMTSEQFEENFRTKIMNGNLNEEKKHAIIDGTKFYYFTLDELKQSKILPGELVTPNGVHHKMMPSASACIVMLLEHLANDTKEAIN